MLTQEQREKRKKGIGGSDAAAILGVNPYCTAMQIWLEKTGRFDPEDISNKPPVYWGNVLEPIVADEYAKINNVKLQKVNQTLIHPKYPWLFGHLDRRIVGLKKILECKTAGIFSAKAWGEPGSDQVPEHYIIQVQHYLSVLDYECADLAVLIGGNDFRIYSIPRDDELINAMTERLNEFWHKNILADMPPDPTSRLEAEQLWRHDNGVIINATDDALLALEEFKHVKAKITDLESQKKKAEAALTKIIGEASGIGINDQVIATWKANKNGSRVLRISGDY